MKECIICIKRKKFLSKLKRGFKKDIQIRNAECIDMMGMDFLYLKKTEACLECDGGGWRHQNDREICPSCNGTGRRLSKERYIDELNECPRCKSTVATISINFKQTSHIHKCKCGWNSKVYDDIDSVTW